MTTAELPLDDLLNRKEAANHLRAMNCTITTARMLAKLACEGGGPPYFMDGNQARYSKSELEKWRRDRLRRKEPK